MAGGRWPGGRDVAVAGVGGRRGIQCAFSWLQPGRGADTYTGRGAEWEGPEASCGKGAERPGVGGEGPGAGS